MLFNHRMTRLVIPLAELLPYIRVWATKLYGMRSCVEVLKGYYSSLRAFRRPALKEEVRGDGPREPESGEHGPKMSPRWAQEGPGSPRWAQDGPKMGPNGPQIGGRGPRRAPRGPKMAPREPKRAHLGLQMGPRWGPKGPKMGPKWAQDRLSEAFEEACRKRPTPDQSHHPILRDLGALLGAPPCLSEVWVFYMYSISCFSKGEP